MKTTRAWPVAAVGVAAMLAVGSVAPVWAQMGGGKSGGGPGGMGGMMGGTMGGTMRGDMDAGEMPADKMADVVKQMSERLASGRQLAPAQAQRLRALGDRLSTAMQAHAAEHRPEHVREMATVLSEMSDLLKRP